MRSAAMLRPVSQAPSAETLLERARALVPQIAACASETAERRDLDPRIVAQLREAGLLRGLQPAEWGGLELDPQIVFDIQNILAEGCVSTAWVQSVLSVQAFMLARFPHDAQRDVWGEDPDMLVCSSFMPAGQVGAVEGGYRLTGRWTFSSGSSHCGWAVLGGLVPPGEGRERPEMRLFLVPRAEYRIDDVWHTFGLRGTGSNDILADDVFVPAYRTLVPDAGMLPLPAASGLSDLYRMPWLYVFTSTISNLSIGAGRGALATFLETARIRRSGPGEAARDNPAVRQAAASLSVALDTAALVSRRNLARLCDAAATGAPITLEEALLYRSQLTGMLRQITDLVDELMPMTGARGIRSDAPLCRIWADLCAARQHAGNDPARNLGLYAGELLGAP